MGLAILRSLAMGFAILMSLAASIAIGAILVSMVLFVLNTIKVFGTLLLALFISRYVALHSGPDK